MVIPIERVNETDAPTPRCFGVVATSTLLRHSTQQHRLSRYSLIYLFQPPYLSCNSFRTTRAIGNVQHENSFSMFSTRIMQRGVPPLRIRYNRIGIYTRGIETTQNHLLVLCYFVSLSGELLHSHWSTWIINIDLHSFQSHTSHFAVSACIRFLQESMYRPYSEIFAECFHDTLTQLCIEKSYIEIRVANANVTIMNV